MKDITISTFQGKVGNMLVRHKSVLDLLSKYQESTARVNRSIIKSVTSCGCLKISAQKQSVPEDINFLDLKDYMNSHLSGELCDNCLYTVEKEIGNHLFYLAGIANTLNLDLDEILEKESEKMATLGKFDFR